MNPTWRRNYLRYKSYFLNVLGKYKERADIKAYLEVLLSLATISVFAVFALRPTLLTIAELIKEIEAKQKTLTIMNEKIQNLSRAQSIYDQEKNKIDLLETAIPKSANPEVFTRQVEGLSGKHQVAVTRLSIKEAVILGQATAKVKEKGETKNFPQNASSLSFSVSATVPNEQFPSLSAFLSDMETLRRPVKIDSLRFDLKRSIEQSMVSLTVEGELPYFTESKIQTTK